MQRVERTVNKMIINNYRYEIRNYRAEDPEIFISDEDRANIRNDKKHRLACAKSRLKRKSKRRKQTCNPK